MARQYDVTSVGVNPVKDRAHRMRVYFIMMTVRVLCIVSLFWVRGLWVIVVAIGAVVLPYLAVLIANAVSHVGGEAPVSPPPLELANPESVSHLSASDTEAPEVIVVDSPAERRGNSGDFKE